ncbi:hypothetical protein Tco_0128169 [Tanacetum coccineum]
MSQATEAQLSLQTREDKELDKACLENKGQDLMNASDLQGDYEKPSKMYRLEKELSKSKTMSKNFESLQKHAINLELDLQHCKEKIKQDKSLSRKSVEQF